MNDKKTEKKEEVRIWPIRNTAKFLSEFEKIAMRFNWYYDESKRGARVFHEIRGVKGEDYRKEYSPLTAYVEVITQKYFDIDRFDLAASEVFMGAECATQIVDASDEWPDRLGGYIPKSYEKAIRKELERICRMR